MTKKRTPKWYPVRAIKPKNHFVSSDYAECPQFVPSYNKEKVNMFLLIAHDYAKMWKMENKAIETKRYEFAGEENERLCRRYVLRALQNKRKVAETKPRFIMKRFQNIPSKVMQYIRCGDQVTTAEINNMSKIASAKDSKDLINEKQMVSARSIHDGCCETPQVTISPEPITCRSEMDALSLDVAISNLLELKGSSQKSKSSRMSERGRGHFHVGFDGSRVHVREMPPGHRHQFKKNAPPH